MAGEDTRRQEGTRASMPTHPGDHWQDVELGEEEVKSPEGPCPGEDGRPPRLHEKKSRSRGGYSKSYNGEGGWKGRLRKSVEGETYKLHRLPPETFTGFHWEPLSSPHASWAFIVFRIFLLLYFTAWLLVAGSAASPSTELRMPLVRDTDSGTFWLIYVSYWTAILLDVYLWCATLCLHPRIGESRFGAITWAIRTIAFPSSCIVTLLYWLAVYPFDVTTSVSDVHIHALNTAIILADLCMARVPLYLRHLYLPWAYATVYTVFSLLYWSAGGTTQDGKPYIYKFLDWRSPGYGVLSYLLISLVILPLVHTGLWRLRKAVVTHVRQRQRRYRRRMKSSHGSYPHLRTTRQDTPYPNAQPPHTQQSSVEGIEEVRDGHVELSEGTGAGGSAFGGSSGSSGRSVSGAAMDVNDTHHPHHHRPSSPRADVDTV